MRFIELEDEKIKYIYETFMVNDFPLCELKPLSIILNAKKENHYRCFALIDDIDNEKDVVCAYTYFASDDNWETVLLDYFAVNENIRGRGTGSKMLELVKDYFKNNTSVSNVIVESESIESAKNDEENFIRTRRIRFYENNGLKKFCCRPVVFGTEYTMLVLEVNKEKEIDETEIVNSYLNIYKSILTEKMFEENIKV